MNQRIKSILKIILGLLLIVGGFPALINSLLIVIGGVTSSSSSDSYNLGRAMGGFVGSLVVWVIGIWLLRSWYKQRKLTRSLVNSRPENVDDQNNQ